MQHVAQLKDVRSYYFRARGSVASIETYPEWAEWPEDMLPHEEPEGQYETSYRWPDAGWILPVKAARLIDKWLSFFYSDPFRRYDEAIRSARLIKLEGTKESSGPATDVSSNLEEGQ